MADTEVKAMRDFWKRSLKKKKGSYTLEASVLMGIILSVLVAVIYLGFWYHDKSFLQSAAYEAVCVAGLKQEEKSWKIENAIQSLIKGRMLGTKNIQVNCQSKGKQAQVSFSGSFEIPGMATVFFGNKKIEILEKCSLTIEKPSDKIQKIRGAVKVVKRAGGGET